MGYEAITTEQSGAVATITLNRPELFNAFNDTMAADLLDAIGWVAGDDSVRSLLITGAGRAFLAGQDVGAINDLRSGGFSRYLAQTWNAVVRGLWTLEKPVVAAVNGPVIGAGVAVPLASDVVLASEEAVFIVAFSKLGFIPDAGVTWLLPRLVGMSRALEIVYLAEPIDAARAERLGLVNEVVSGADLMERAHAVAQRLAAGPTGAYGAAKRVMHRAVELSFDEALELEGAVQDAVGATEDNLEGVAAFLEKRAPQFKGR